MGSSLERDPRATRTRRSHEVARTADTTPVRLGGVRFESVLRSILRSNNLDVARPATRGALIVHVALPLPRTFCTIVSHRRNERTDAMAPSA